ncbi:hypothetical protein H072_2135 [Dactylellina haptotyla CBS 200.50]|uniref:Rhodanese domain-containing protein n=1 Tax=Dactylellina haptotyla (strain CBS 200.50) TaxID=1284197 RepID=S8AM10_DACHA|nr:hypothetical protein H072_2135 [Dactylellina haptotyla CBS 200.50]
MPLKLPRILPPGTFSKALLANPSYLSSTPQIVPINATWFMPNDPAKRTGAKSHTQLRIPHSRFFDIDTVKDASIDLPHMLPPASKFVAAMRKLKIRRDDWLVFYDSWENGILSAPRAAWTARLMGHESVSVLNNFKIYVDQQVGPVVKGEEGLYDYEGREIALQDEYPEDIKVVSGRVVGFDEVTGLARENLKNPGDVKVQIFDARPGGRFAGKDPEPRPGLSSGHIPGSISVPFMSLLDGNDKALLPSAQLREILDKAGVKDDGKMKIASCGTGVTAAVVELALEEAGYGEGEGERRVYDGSWTEWAQKADKELIVKNV